MIPKDISQDVVNRLKSIAGQIEGLIRMLESDEYPEKIFNWFKAAQSGLDKVYHLLLDEVYRKALVIRIVETVNACPGNCDNEDKIGFIRQQFPTFSLDELTQKMKEISKLKEKAEQFRRG
ncbi:MAG: metal-sensitive transcriptional regulator [Chitinophagaceae bacterium]|nr:MAG: metal-sensitive transcriptional regulator [Chitinophagaceae bacterium]